MKALALGRALGRAAAVAVAAVLAAGAAQAQDGPFLRLSIDGAIRPETAAALAQLVESATTARLRDLVIARGTPVDAICADRTCTPALAQWNAAPLPADAGRLTVAALPGPSVAGRPDYVLLLDPAAPTPAGGKVGLALDPATTAGVDPATAADVRGLIAAAASLPGDAAPRPIGNDAADKVDLIAHDVAALGASDRTLRLADGLAPEARARLLAIVAADPAVAAAVPTAAPSDVDFIYPDPVSFQASAETCAPTPPGWPFDAAAVADVLRFDQGVLARLGFGGPRRARILVIDTGLGPALVDDPAFRHGLYADLDEALSAPVAYARLDAPECLDRNRNTHPGDVFGTNAGPDSTGPDCAAPGFAAAQVAPLPPRPKATQTYLPDHGSYVAGLALGGPALLAAYPEVAGLLGVTMFRVTRPPVDASQSVQTDGSDIRAGLVYAGAIGADVVNLSAKTRDDKPFIGLDQVAHGLLVVSAGNQGEGLDGIAMGNRPAALADGALRARMIVVAALQPGDPMWWPSSAHSAVKVDIAAPGADITSWRADGGALCASGTSAAAPLVSFTAAAISALGLSAPELIRARILSSADRVPALAADVAAGRVLDIPAALDLFVDQVRIAGESAPRRGWIAPGDLPLLAICPSDTTSLLMGQRGVIDLSKLWSWRRVDVAGQPAVSFDHRLEADGGFQTWTCEGPPEGSFAFYDLATHTTGPIDWSAVQSIVPTPFRAAEAAVMQE